MITKFEINAIKAFLLLNRDNSEHYISTNHSNIQVSKDCNTLLSFFLNEYNRENHTKIGKSLYVHTLLCEFLKQEKAIIGMEDVDEESWNDNVHSALKQWKKIANQYIDDSITTITGSIFAIVIWHTCRNYELKNDMRITNFVDDNYEGRNIKLEPDIPDFSVLGKKEIKKIAEEESKLITLYVPKPTDRPIPYIIPPEEALAILNESDQDTEAQEPSTQPVPPLPPRMPQITAHREPVSVSIPAPVPVPVDIPFPVSQPVLKMHQPIPPPVIQTDQHKRVVVIRKKEPVHDISDLVEDEEPKKEMTREELLQVIRKKAGGH